MIPWPSCAAPATNVPTRRRSTRRARCAPVPSRPGRASSVVRAWLEEAYVLLALQRPAEAAEASQQALDCLLAGAKPALSAFATGFERELYLTAISYQARALMAAQDHAAIIALCEPVIRDLEGERLRVSSPYQQSAFLATRPRAV